MVICSARYSWQKEDEIEEARKLQLGIANTAETNHSPEYREFLANVKAFVESKELEIEKPSSEISPLTRIWEVPLLLNERVDLHEALNVKFAAELALYDELLQELRSFAKQVNLYVPHIMCAIEFYNHF